MSFMINLMKLGNAIDAETKNLFGQFCVTALCSDDVNQFVKRALRRALEPDEPEKQPMVDATVVSVGPNQKPRRKTQVRRK